LTLVEVAQLEVPNFKELSQQLTRNFVINGKAQSTLNNYLRCLAHLGLHYKISPEQLSEEQIQDYLYHCKNLHNTPSESFFKHTVYGLRSVYKVLGLKDKRISLPQIKAQNSLPVVLSKQEVKQLLKAPKYLRHRLMLGMLYGCGLRSYELCNLKLSEVDFERKTVFIRKQKGNYDRYVPLSNLLISGLKKYISTESPVEYLFNSQVTDNGKSRGLSSSSIQWVIKENRSKVDTSKKITAHTLRHTYATHLLEEGLNIMALKELLGHARIETTILYLHVTNTGNSIKFSPLDRLYQ
jgi:integrase/recombinase XerD